MLLALVRKTHGNKVETGAPVFLYQETLAFRQGERLINAVDDEPLTSSSHMQNLEGMLYFAFNRLIRIIRTRAGNRNSEDANLPP